MARRVFDVYRSFGKIYLMMGDYPLALLDEITRNGRPDRLISIVRPGELGLEKWVKPVHEIRGPNGDAVLWIFILPCNGFREKKVDAKSINFEAFVAKSYL